MKKITLFFLWSFGLSILWSQTSSPVFLVSTGLAVPMGPSVEDVEGAPYTPGLKIDGRGFFSIGSSGFAMHTQLGLNIAPLDGSNSDGTALTLLSIQGGPSFSVNPTGALQLGITGQGGSYLGMIDGAMGVHSVLSARADVNLSLNPALTLGLGGDYSYYMSQSTDTLDHTWSGVGVSLNIKYLLGQSTERKSRLEIEEIIIFPVYPVLYSYYNDNKLGEITIRNTESATIENVAVSLYIPKYMAGPQSFQTGETLKRGEVKTLPIFGLLDSSILDETEGALVQAQVGVSYDLKSHSLAQNSDSQAEVLYRNALTWDDDRRAASFVTAKEPGIMEFAKNTTAAVRDGMNGEMDQSLTQAMALFEALSLYGIKYQIDPSSSYKEISGQERILDYLQFPIETLNYKAGDCDDMSVLYAAVLESLAVETAFITVPGHIYTAVALSMSPEEAQRTFARAESIIYKNDKAWIPVETTMLDGNTFLEAWTEGSRQWQEAVLHDKAMLYPVQEAWQNYPPVALNAYRDKELVLPEAVQLSRNYSNQESRLIEQEISTQVAYLEKAIRESRGERRYRMINSLAVLKARYGLFDEAVDLLEAVTTPDIAYAPGATNLANIYYRQGDMDRAATYYNMALNSGENQPKALLGLMLVASEQGNNMLMQSSYKELTTISPAMAEKYAYLINGSDDVKRASEAGQKERVVWDEE